MGNLAGQLSSRSQATYRFDANHFARWLEAKGLALATLARSDFIQYRSYLAENYAKATVARMLTVARRILEEGVKRGDLAANPARDIRGLRPVTTRHLTPPLPGSRPVSS